MFLLLTLCDTSEGGVKKVSNKRFVENLFQLQTLTNLWFDAEQKVCQSRKEESVRSKNIC